MPSDTTKSLDVQHCIPDSWWRLYLSRGTTSRLPGRKNPTTHDWTKLCAKMTARERDTYHLRFQSECHTRLSSKTVRR